MDNGSICLNSRFVCDGVTNCKDKSDEDRAICDLWNCTAGYWKCEDGQMCIPEKHVCDGISVHMLGQWTRVETEVNCKDESDEDPILCSLWKCQ